METRNYSSANRPNNNAVINRFNTPQLPAAYLSESTVSLNQGCRAEIKVRRTRRDDLRQQREEGLSNLQQLDKTYHDFVALAESFLDADNAKNPTADQNQTICDLNESIADVVLAGDQASGGQRAQTSAKISAKMLNLKDAADTARKAWNALCKEHDEEVTALEKLEKNSGVDGGAILGDQMLYCPFRDNKAMVRSSELVIIDLWNMINGPQMLELNFGKLQNLLSNLKKSLKAEVRAHLPGKMFSDICEILL